MIRRLPRAPELRAAWWTHRALRRTRQELAASEVHDVIVPDPPRLPPRAVRGVESVLRRRRHTCLEGAMVRQRWYAAHGVRRDVVIAVTAPEKGFKAHAWLDLSGRPPVADSWHEIKRLIP